MQCENCLNEAGFYCSGCGEALYCSLQCQEENWYQQHHIDCKYTENLEINEGIQMVDEPCEFDIEVKHGRTFKIGGFMESETKQWTLYVPKGLRLLGKRQIQASKEFYYELEASEIGKYEVTAIESSLTKQYQTRIVKILVRSAITCHEPGYLAS